MEYIEIKGLLPINSARLVLTAAGTADVNWLTDMSLDEHINEFESKNIPAWATISQLRAAANSAIQSSYKPNHPDPSLHIIIRCDDIPIGNITIRMITPGEHDRLIFGYWLAPKAEHNGFMFEALSILIDKLKNTETESITLKIHKENQASLKLATRLGFETVPNEKLGARNILVLIKDLRDTEQT